MDWFNFAILRPYLLVALAACALAYLAVWLVTQWRVDVQAGNRLEKFAGNDSGVALRVGRVALRAIGKDTARSWAGALEWAQLGGHYAGETTAHLVGRMALLALLGAGVAVVSGVPALWLLPPLLAFYPYAGLNGKAEQVKRHVTRAIPEVAALLAAELAAGNAPETGVLRAAELSGELGALFQRAIAESRAGGRPLFSRPPVRGTLVEGLGGTGLDSLTAFARQLDLVAGKGVGGAQLMSTLARQLAREHLAQVLARAARLENELLLPTTLFFFLPFMAAIGAPIVLSLMKAF